MNLVTQILPKVDAFVLIIRHSAALSVYKGKNHLEKINTIPQINQNNISFRIFYLGKNKFNLSWA